MLCVANKIMREPVNVFQNILEILTRVVVPSVSSILIVHRIVPVCVINAWIHVLEPVLKMLIVRWLTINPHAIVALVTPEIRTHSAILSLKNVRMCSLLTLSNPFWNFCLLLINQSQWLTANDVAVYVNPCHPSPCGPNSQCREINGQAVCSCLQSFIGTPPGCRPECVQSTECPRDKACVSQKCVNPCSDACGTNAICRVVNHSPICSCQNGHTGNPFTRCYPIPRKPLFIIVSLSAYLLTSNILSSSCATDIHWRNSRSLLSITMWTEFSMQKL